MNKERRQKIKKVISDLENIQTEVANVLDDEETTYDNMPESLQSSINGMTSEEAINGLQEAMDNIETIVDALNEVVLL